MKTYYISLLCLMFVACSDGPKVSEESEELEVTLEKDEPEVKFKKTNDLELIQEELESEIDEGSSIEVIYQNKLNDSVNFYITQVKGGDCTMAFLTTFLNGKNYLSVEVEKECKFSKKSVLREWKSFKRLSDSKLKVTEHVKYVPKNLLEEWNDLEDVNDSSFVNDSLVKEVEVNDKGEIKIQVINDFEHYANPTFKSVDHEGDFRKVFIVIVDTGMNYFELNHKMYTLSNGMRLPIDTLGRYYNTDIKKIILPEDSDDEIYAGDYVHRRFEENTLSIEYLSFYNEHSLEETMALFAGMFPNKSKATKLLQKLQKKYPNSWLLETNVFMGCMH